MKMYHSYEIYRERFYLGLKKRGKIAIGTCCTLLGFYTHPNHDFRCSVDAKTRLKNLSTKRFNEKTIHWS